MILETWIGIGCILGCLVLVQSGMHIAVALMLLSLFGVSMVIGIEPAGRMLAASSVSSISSYLFGVIPLFVLMGLVVSVTSLGRDLFDASGNLMKRVRGGLGMSTVIANAVFAACTGTSIASASVFTRIAVPELERLGYTTRFSVGVVAGSSILGMLIPPSLLFIIFGVIANVSIGELFIAAILPGALMAVAFCVTIFLLSVFAPGFVHADGAPTAAESQAATRSAMAGIWIAIKPLIPVGALVFVVLGGIYGGFFTPTEAGAVGALAAIVIGLLRRELTLRNIWDVVLETGRVTASIIFLLMAAQIYSQMLTLTGLPMTLNDWMTASGIGAVGFVILYLLLLILLGTFLDSMSILLIVVPFALVFANQFGLDLLWFGVLSVIAVEIGLLTPPLGLSCFVVKATLNREDVTIRDIFIGSFPFFLTMLSVLALVALVPQIALIAL
ncbi:MAG: TRAP transporter large permease subunit [Maritimibacter sp.]|jgi:C4-dicarboxylate transporter DctM subunit|uniref:TRAP transporter large permease n=1 Tax=Maritimibacter sp. TaxID=2003363 RepID=UPI001D1B329B|nr:TRAP transporter large permease subunit [Maritimibacter sp.]MBL6430253.1 TRAP transporter large permease subunit [Maritimibacter sp.]